ncbi:MAG: Trk system potassium transporter TrkA [Oscillospiraceae bacterium]
MKIIIVGDGKVGHTLSQQLVQEGHDITVIDNNSEILDTAMESLDIIGIHGNGASVEVLKEAGVSTADLLIAATSADELNMLCCLTAKHLGVGKTIARVRNPEYRSQLQMLQNEFGLSMVINPELEAAREISRVIKFPPASRIDTFTRGQVELVEYRIPEHSLLAGMKLLELPSLSGTKVLICAVERAGAVHIPNGGFVLRAGDRIHLTGQGKEIARFLGHVDDVKFKIRTILIVGGGRIAYYLCNMLEDKYFHIKIVEKNRERAEELCELFPKVTVIHGDGADIELLEAEGLADTDAFIALTNMDEENLVTSIMADQHDIPKIITKSGASTTCPSWRTWASTRWSTPR